MTGNARDDDALETLFAAGRSERPSPSGEFLERLAASVDAGTARPAPAPAGLPVLRFAWLGRAFAASGLSGAAALGVWIGFAMPDAIDALTLGSDDTVALATFLPGTDLEAILDE
ncbi:MAG: hypothetical protein F4Y60_07590 [Boseongicola sp. SB0664_bin_43]|uniref:Dihydroorotate dehydrogenase n=1 Tax=Boseongicola sp. SB0664_bin_43 TaxID=2604844 RepID=A0A6B0XZ38_9RHOB|nr:hypothetical protein [Boseongicola sp. SB0664_bin_43]MYK31766.1 hypothetical protein [Boseongicola sp. SB0670_bin_30]